MKNVIIAIIAAAVLYGCQNSRFGKGGCLPDVKEEIDNGQNCEYSDSELQLVITCGDNVYVVPKQSEVITGPQGENGADGINGQDGVDGADGYIVDAIYICPDETARHREIALLTVNGEYIVYLQDSDTSPNRRLTFLQEGLNYRTTDGNGNDCRFSVVDGEFIRRN